MDHGLTARELECLRLAGRRLRDKEIAARLGIEVGTVKNHLASARRKLGASSRLTAAAKLSLLDTGAEWAISDGPGQVLPSPGSIGSTEDGEGRGGASGGRTTVSSPSSFRRPFRLGGSLLPTILLFCLLGLTVLVAAAGLFAAFVHSVDPLAEHRYQQMTGPRS